MQFGALLKMRFPVAHFTNMFPRTILSGNFAQQTSHKKIHTRKLPYVSNNAYNIGLEKECFYVAPNIGYSYVSAKNIENTNHLKLAPRL